MSKLTKFREKIEAWMSAAAFAEANDQDTALAMVGADPAAQKILAWDDITCALAFAEAGELGLARQYLGVEKPATRLNVLELPGVRVWFGRVSMPVPALAGVRVWSGTAAV
ncbi:MAG: hypothetical protein ABIM40_11570 [Pseudomonadota bacterium]